MSREKNENECLCYFVEVGVGLGQLQQELVVEG